VDHHDNLPFPEPPRQSATSGAPGGHIRVGDADRDVVSRRLSRAVADGRLTLTEYDTRLQRLYRAETRGELAEVVSDLPRSDDRDEPKRQRKQSIPAWVVIMWMPWVAVNLLCLAIWLATGAGYFWPFWVAVPWGCALLIPSTIGVFASGGTSGAGDSPAASSAARRRSCSAASRSARAAHRWSSAAT
jgi:hypothetical protein